MTELSLFFGAVRALLGDREVFGFWSYDDDAVLGAIRAVFALGRGPEGYALAGGGPGAETGLEPEMVYGDPFALVAYETAMILLGSESSADYRTRELSVSGAHGGQRDLLRDLRQLVFEIRSSGGMVFATFQSFGAFLGLQKDDGRFPFADLARVNLRTPLPDVTL